MRKLFAIVAAWLVLATVARAQDDDVPVIPYEGPHLFCHVLHTNKMTPLASWREASEEPKQTTIIIFGNPAFLYGFIEDSVSPDIKLRNFLDNGGSLLIATDHRFAAPELSIEFTGEPVATSVEEFAYRGELECPLLKYSYPDLYLSPDMKLTANPKKGKGHVLWLKSTDFRDHPLFGFLHQGIATNYPSHLLLMNGNHGSKALLEFPVSNRVFHQWPPGPLLLHMAGSPKNAPPQGRALYIAGHGMFINAMMAQTDSDNFEFAGNAVRWLREGPKDGTPHSKALFVVDGEIITNFDMNLTPPVPPIPVPPVQALNRLLRGWENERFFQNMLADALGSNMGRFIAVVLAIVTFLVLLYGVKKFMEARHHSQLLGPQPLGNDATPSEQRQQALLQKGDFWEASRYLAVEWLRREVAVTPGQARFHAQGFLWSRWRLQRQADEVLRLAHSATPIGVSRHRFFVLVETLKELSAALKHGRLALQVEGKNVRQS